MCDIAALYFNVLRKLKHNNFFTADYVRSRSKINKQTQYYYNY
jgi:hypothetical protein